MKIGKAVVVGAGAPAALAALALHRAFARGGLEVCWIETPSSSDAQQFYAALPNIGSFHRLLGIHEGALLRATGGAFSLGCQYVGFSGEGSGFMHGYGPVGQPFGSLPFAQFWIKARVGGMPAGYADFARDAVAALNGRLQLPEKGSPAPTAHGYHLDACAYADLLRDRASKLGIAIRADDAPHAVVRDGRVAAIRLSEGEEVASDLFIDATGSDASILSAIDDAKPEPSPISGIDRFMQADAKPLSPVPLYARNSAHRAGWTTMLPMQHKVALEVAYDSATVSDEEAIRLAGAPLAGEPVFRSITPQRRAQPWVGNVVAIGDAAEAPDPIGSTSLHRLQIAITHLVALFPVRADTMPEAAIYNEEIAAFSARLGDFQAAHYTLNRRDEPFWTAARERPISDELRAKIDLFEARGRIAQYNQESFSEDEWIVAFLGHGLVPRSYDPQVDRVPEQQVMAAFKAQLSSIRADVTAMDTHQAALAKAIRG
jgi:tryptophan 7-halogenase